MSRFRLLPQRRFPSYAYLPGRQPHPVRNPAGHSYGHVEPAPAAGEVLLDADAFLWGLDLFNHGYYWEAHEAWEGLWQIADRGSALRMLLKGLILLSASGVKIREGKRAAAARHAGRAAALFRQLTKVPDRSFEPALGLSPMVLGDRIEAAVSIPVSLEVIASGQPQAVFDFILGPDPRRMPGEPSGRNSRP